MQKDTHKQEVISFIEEELRGITQLREEIAECKDNSRVYRRAKASILHDFYNACERIFEAIAREVNGGLPDSQQWHKKLLH